MARRKGRPTRDDAEPRPAAGDSGGEDWRDVYGTVCLHSDGTSHGDPVCPDARPVNPLWLNGPTEPWVELDDTYEGLRFPDTAGPQAQADDRGA